MPLNPRMLNTGGGTITISNQFAFAGSVSNLAWSVLLPTGWSFASTDAAATDVKPTAGATNLIEWRWTALPANPVSFAYTLNVPVGDLAPHPLVALVALSYEGTPIQFTAKPDPLMAGFAHSADTNRDFRLSLLELTRVIELYNTRNGSVRTGCYTTADTTEDEFASDPIRANSAAIVLPRYHSADSNRDGRIGLLELTRVIELYNYRSGTVRTGQYHAQSGTEDGFAPGP